MQRFSPNLIYHKELAPMHEKHLISIKEGKEDFYSI
jgi:hypothetical protein